MKTAKANYILVFLQTVLMVLVVPNVHAIEWEHNIVADKEGNYHIYWTTERDLITFEIQVRTLGYVCFGFSAQGGMNGSDLVIGWVNGSNAELQDRFATSEDGEPEMDAKIDYQLLSGSKNETHTVLRFQRKIDTCDDHDYFLTRDSVYLIYAWHSHDLTKEVTCQTDNKGTVLVELFVKAEDKNIEPNEVILDLLNDNVTVNPADTSYWCTFHLIPGDKELLTRSAPLIQSGHESLLHHVRFLRCSPDVKYLISQFGTSMNCTSDDIHSRILSTCADFITGYTVGTQSIVLPRGTGFPLGNNGKDSYYVLETHYNNADKTLPSYLDHSGLQLYLKGNQSEYEAGMIFLQTQTDGTVIIPPKQESFTLVAHFPSECTSKFIPAGGINISAALFHAHYSARTFRLRQFRDGIELPTIFSVSNYNFNRQINYFLIPERKVLPGDFLTLECTYNTENQNASTLGGVESFNEMCLVILSHYPRIKVDNVFSGLSPDKISKMRTLGNMLSEDTGEMTDVEFFQRFDWDGGKSSQNLTEQLQKAQRDDEILVQCLQGRTPLEVVNAAYPSIASPYVEPPRKC